MVKVSGCKPGELSLTIILTFHSHTPSMRTCVHEHLFVKSGFSERLIANKRSMYPMYVLCSTVLHIYAFWFLLCYCYYSDAWIRRTQYHLANLCARTFSDPAHTYSLNSIRNAAGATAVTIGLPKTDVADAMGYKSYRHIRRLSSIKANVSTAGFMNIKII